MLRQVISSKESSLKFLKTASANYSSRKSNDKVSFVFEWDCQDNYRKLSRIESSASNLEEKDELTKQNLTCAVQQAEDVNPICENELGPCDNVPSRMPEENILQEATCSAESSSNSSHFDMSTEAISIQHSHPLAVTRLQEGNCFEESPSKSSHFDGFKGVISSQNSRSRTVTKLVSSFYRNYAEFKLEALPSCWLKFCRNITDSKLDFLIRHDTQRCSFEKYLGKYLGQANINGLGFIFGVATDLSTFDDCMFTGGTLSLLGKFVQNANLNVPQLFLNESSNIYKDTLDLSNFYNSIDVLNFLDFMLLGKHLFVQNENATSSNDILGFLSKISSTEAAKQRQGLPEVLRSDISGNTLNVRNFMKDIVVDVCFRSDKKMNFVDFMLLGIHLFVQNENATSPNDILGFLSKISSKEAAKQRQGLQEVLRSDISGNTLNVWNFMKDIVVDVCFRSVKNNHLLAELYAYKDVINKEISTTGNESSERILVCINVADELICGKLLSSDFFETNQLSTFVEDYCLQQTYITSKSFVLNIRIHKKKNEALEENLNKRSFQSYLREKHLAEKLGLFEVSTKTDSLQTQMSLARENYETSNTFRITKQSDYEIKTKISGGEESGILKPLTVEQLQIVKGILKHLIVEQLQIVLCVVILACGIWHLLQPTDRELHTQTDDLLTDIKLHAVGLDEFPLIKPVFALSWYEKKQVSSEKLKVLGRESRIIVLVSETEVHTKEEMRLERGPQYKLAVVTAEGFEDAWRQSLVKENTLEYSNFFPRDSKMIVGIPVYRLGFINRSDLKDRKLVLHEYSSII